MSGAIPDSVKGREPRPFRDWMLDAHNLGFAMRVDVEANLFRVWVILEPVTRKAKTACDRALDDNCEYITCETIYDKARHELWVAGLVPPPIEDEAKVIRFAIDDTAAYALRMAREALFHAKV